MPPGISNYQQRAGRAGRRAQVAPIALTIARQSRYDQVTFDQFDDYLASLPSMPYLSLENSAFLHRHQVSCVLAGWLSLRITTSDRKGAPRLRHVFGDRIDAAALTEIDAQLADWLVGESGKERLAVAEKMAVGLGHALTGNNLVNRVKAEIRRWIYEVSERWQVMDVAVQEAQKQLNAGGLSEEDSTRLTSRMNGQNQNKRRYMDQSVTNLLSQQAVIPTYSFPIHSLHLEMITERGANSSDSGPDLNRDAALAIAEYAPGAEVVAAGRIWRSAGIARRRTYSGGAESYMDRGWYRICKNCNHPQMGIEIEEFKQDCPHCKSPARDRARRYLEPIGFLTAYHERMGRDPGTSRMRTKMVDEARLITRAGREHYRETDMPGIATFFAPAHRKPSDQSDLVGRMIVVNRGPKAGGYLSCSRCEHAQPADSPGQMSAKAPHKNPRSGDPCPQDTVSFPQDLAHQYNTDIRGLRLSHKLPSSGGLNREEQEKLRTSLLRTTAEALRLAAAILLETDPRDLRSSTEMADEEEPLIILSDATPGGAGYVRRLVEEPRFSVRTLLAKALEILDCPRGDICSTSCNKCLNDYSNQQFWESFDRHLAAKWLKDLLSWYAERPAHIPESSVPVATFTARALAALIAMNNKLVVTGSRLWGAGTSEAEAEEAIVSARIVRDWLEADTYRQVTFVVRESASNSSRSEATTVDKTVADILIGAHKGGQIVFFKAPDHLLAGAPRLTSFGSGSRGATISEWYTQDESASVFAAAPAGIRHRNETTEPWLAQVMDRISRISSPLDVQERAMKAYRFSTSRSRDLGSIFSTIKPAQYDVVVSDPYIAANRGKRVKLLNFISEIEKSAIKIGSLKIRWKPGESHESADDQIDDLGKILKGHYKSIAFVPWDGEGHFHDRQVLFRAEGTTDIIRLDITSGIDNLMSANRECSVFVEHPK